MTRITDLVEALASFDVHTGFPDKRLALAGKLLNDAVTVDDVDALGAHCAGTMGDPIAAARVLVSILADPEKRASRLADLALVARTRADRRARVEGRQIGDRRTVPQPMAEEPHETWEHDRLCRIAYCIAVADGKGAQVAANHLGVPFEKIHAMIARGKILQRGGKERFA